MVNEWWANWVTVIKSIDGGTGELPEIYRAVARIGTALDQIAKNTHDIVRELKKK